MTATATVRTNIKQIVTNKGYLWLFVLASIVWVSITGPIFWKPLPYFDDSFSISSFHDDEDAVSPVYLIVKNCPVDDIKALSKNGDPIYEACRNRIAAQVQDEVDQERLGLILRWASIVLLVPVVLPLLLSLMALIGAAIFQWINDGYSRM